MLALVKITSHIRTYEPGQKLGSEFSENEIKRLIRLKAIDGSEDYVENIDDDDFFNGNDPDEFLTESELSKLKKDELLEYATKIGLNGLTKNSTNEQLVNDILNYIEEIEAQV